MRAPTPKSNRIGLIVAVLVIIALLIVWAQYYSAWYSATDKTGAKDFIGIGIGNLLSDPVGLLFYQTEGSAPLLKFWPLALAWIWGSMFIRWRYHKYTYYWSSLSWSVIATGIIVTSWWWAAVVQYNQWYACFPRMVQGVMHQCYPGEQGTLDFTTHIATPGATAAVTCTLDIMGLLGLHGRIGRTLEIGIGFTLNALDLPTIFEWIETQNPAVYWSVYTNSLTDMGAALIAVTLVILAYNLVTPYEEG